MSQKKKSVPRRVWYNEFVKGVSVYWLQFFCSLISQISECLAMAICTIRLDCLLLYRAIPIIEWVYCNGIYAPTMLNLFITKMMFHFYCRFSKAHIFFSTFTFLLSIIVGRLSWPVHYFANNGGWLYERDIKIIFPDTF